MTQDLIQSLFIIFSITAWVFGAPIPLPLGPGVSLVDSTQLAPRYIIYNAPRRRMATGMTGGYWAGLPAYPAVVTEPSDFPHNTDGSDDKSKLIPSHYRYFNIAGRPIRRGAKPPAGLASRFKGFSDSDFAKAVSKFWKELRPKLSWRYHWPIKQTPPEIASDVKALPKAVANSDTVDAGKGVWRWVKMTAKNMFYDKTVDHPWLRPKQKGKERILEGAPTEETPWPRPKDVKPVAANVDVKVDSDAQAPNNGRPKKTVHFSDNEHLPG